MTELRTSSLLFFACSAAALLSIATTSPRSARAEEGAQEPATSTGAARSTEPSVFHAAPTKSHEGPRVLYPPERIPLRFDHARHVEKSGLTCAYCHTRATVSRKAEDRLAAPPDRCDACHGTNHDDLGHVTAGVGAAKDCAYCHERTAGPDANAVARVSTPPPFFRFDHAAHWARGIPCTRCHESVAKEALATSADLPSMQSCLDCHAAGGTAANRASCDVCHLTEHGRLKTNFPTGELLPPAWMRDMEHGPDFILRHRTVAGADSAACANCHTEKECVDCHDGRVRPRTIHPNDWLAMHPIAARQNDPVCTSCHHEQSFCITCHQRLGIAQTSPSATEGSRSRFHPPKAVWTDLPRTPAHHSFEAERNIAACVSCHNERDCALCHATAARGGRGGLSPHPPGFAASCRGALEKNARPCLFCHAPSDPTLAACR